MFRLKLLWRRLRGQLWFLPAVWSLAAIGVALLAALTSLFVDDDTFPDLKQDTLEGLLKIIASSMLTVSTFSLSIMVAAFSSTAQNGTPRATRLVMTDSGAQRAISAFISAFIFSMTGLTALGFHYYSSSGRFVMLMFTVVVLAYLILALLRWINTLSQLGRMSHTIQTVERAATEAMTNWRQSPSLGTQPGAPADPLGWAIYPSRTGYLQYVDFQTVENLAKELGAQVHVRVWPGTFVAPATLIAVLSGPRTADAEQARKLARAFEVGSERTEEQDPRYGLLILSQIAQRALSPGINDPGTAIIVASSLARVLIDGMAKRPGARAGDQAGNEGGKVDFPNVTILPLDEGELLHDVFEPIARDGAGTLEVGVAIQDMLALIASNTTGSLSAAAKIEAAHADEHGQQGLAIERQREVLESVVQRIA